MRRERFACSKDGATTRSSLNPFQISKITIAEEGDLSKTWDCARINYGIKSILSYERGQKCPRFFVAVKGQPGGHHLPTVRYSCESTPAHGAVPAAKIHGSITNWFAVLPVGTRDLGGGGAAYMNSCCEGL